MRCTVLESLFAWPLFRLTHLHEHDSESSCERILEPIEVIDNTESSLTLSGERDPADRVGERFIGVRRLQRLDVRGAAHLDFGEERIVIVQPGGLTVDLGATVELGEFDAKTRQSMSIAPPEGHVVQRHR